MSRNRQKWGRLKHQAPCPTNSLGFPIHFQKLHNPATLSHPLKISSLSVSTLGSQMWSLCGRKGDSLSRLCQVPSYQNILNRVLAMPVFQADTKGAEGRCLRAWGEGCGGDVFTKSLDLSVCVTSEEMIKSGSSL